MADKPIIFSAPMVRALLDGLKTQTRRVLNPQPVPCLIWGDPPDGTYPSKKGWSRFPYAPGDRLWVKETFQTGIWRGQDLQVTYRATMEWPWDGPWRSPIFMPRKLSRLTLTVTDVRVQRLQEIIEADAMAEGATPRTNCSGFMSRDQGWSMDWSQVGQLSAHATGATRTAKAPLTESDISLQDPQMAFSSYFNSLHGPAAWDANPWVVALTFDVQRGNIDHMKKSAQ